MVLDRYDVIFLYYVTIINIIIHSWCRHVEILIIGMPPNPASGAPGGGGEPAEPSAPNSGAAKVQKLPIPEQFLPIQKSFDDALQRCLTAPNLSPVRFWKFEKF